MVAKTMDPRLPNGFQFLEAPEIDFGGEAPLPPEDYLQVEMGGRRRIEWLIKRRMRIMAKFANDKLGRVKRYTGIIMRYARGEEDIEFARVAYECLGKALEIKPEVKK